MIYSAVKKQNGFTLIESLIGIAIFLMLANVVYQTFFLTYRNAIANWENTTVSSLASQYLETARNISYAQVGTIQGNPHGDLPDFLNALSVTVGSTAYQAYFEVTYIDDPADGTALSSTDIAPNDYKQVKLSIKNTTTNKITNYVTNIVQTGLENMINGGALSLSVINAVGQPVPNATINIINNSLNPSINLTRTSDANGQLVEVGLPDSANSYHIIVTKNGYSSDQTYPASGQNPNPTKPDATIINGQVTQISFSIDKTSNLTFNTLNQTCSPVPGVGLRVQGAKIIGTPNVLKYDNLFTSNSNGQIVLNNIEWDTYTPTLLNGQDLIVYGTSPIQKIDVLPDTTQTYSMILGNNSTANSLLVIVKDAATGTALENASAHLQKGGSTPQDYYGVTGGSVWTQSDWSGGGGAAEWSSSTSTQYFGDDGNVDANSAPTGLRLKKITGRYVMNGWMESSTFDTGTSSTNYTILNWQPTSQSSNTILQFQIAANNDNATWNYVGPDGTAGTYFATPGENIGNSLDNKRYARYKAFLSTTDDHNTPVLTSININFVVGCFTPGQVIFSDLTAGNNYALDVSLTGYQTQIIDPITINGNQPLEVLMSP